MPKKKSDGRIDITPTWRVATSIWLRIIDRGTPKGKELAEKQLLVMADKLDKLVELQKKGKLKILT